MPLDPNALATAAISILIPTADGNPSVRHPDVLHFAQPWHGYEYWMVFTPYPGPSRELPNLVASHDGLAWEVPAGAHEELVSLKDVQAAGYTYGSDTDMVLTPDNKLRIYYRTAQVQTADANKEGIWMIESADGLAWTAPALLFTVAAVAPMDTNSYAQVLSPAVVIGPDGIWRMWTVNRKSMPGKVELRTSDDGVTWSKPVDTIIPQNEIPWHPNVIYRDGQYVMMMQEATQVIRIMVSNDGLTWIGQGISFPYFAREFFTEANYRSALVAGAKPGYWDVYLSGYKHATGDSRFVMLKNLHLTAP